MSHSQFHSIKSFILRHAWLNLWDKRMLLAESTRLLSFQPPLPSSCELRDLDCLLTSSPLLEAYRRLGIYTQQSNSLSCYPLTHSQFHMFKCIGRTRQKRSLTHRYHSFQPIALQHASLICRSFKSTSSLEFFWFPPLTRLELCLQHFPTSLLLLGSNNNCSPSLCSTRSFYIFSNFSQTDRPRMPTPKVSNFMLFAQH